MVASNKKIFIKLIFISLVYIFMVIALWFDLGEITNVEGKVIKSTWGIKIIITLLGALIFGMTWFLFNYQKKQEEKFKKMEQNIVPKQDEQSTGSKILSTTYKFSGWNLRIKAIITAVIAIALFGFGIYFLITTSIAGLVFIGIGLVVFLGAWFYWKRAKSLVKGKFY